MQQEFRNPTYGCTAHTAGCLLLLFLILSTHRLLVLPLHAVAAVAGDVSQKTSVPEEDSDLRFQHKDIRRNKKERLTTGKHRSSLINQPV
jgi:hypothetical protein